MRISPVVWVAATVWSVWMFALGPAHAWSYVVNYWQASLTMLFGSLLAGSTTLGGGAVAFPVFTKVLHVSVVDSKIFSLMIQSIGMGAATVIIVLKRIPVDWRIIFVSTLSGALGMIVGSWLLAPMIPPYVVKTLFTMMLTSFGITLLILNMRKERRRNFVPVWTNKEVLVILLAGGAGGALSALYGSGIDVIIFSVMVLFFRVSEKIATPTSVVIMALNSMVGAFFHNFVLYDTTPIVIEYWYAAIPVVVVGAPLGVLLCNILTRERISYFLLFLISVELVSTLVLLPVKLSSFYESFVMLLSFLVVNVMMLRAKRYRLYAGDSDEGLL